MRPRRRVKNPEYKGSGKLHGKVVLIRGGDSAIGRAMAGAFARERRERRHRGVHAIVGPQRGPARHPGQWRSAGAGLDPLIPSIFPPEKVESFGSDIPLKRVGQPEEVAPSYVCLASDDLSYMTGQTLHPNRGTVVNG